jgi:MFS family permease
MPTFMVAASAFLIRDEMALDEAWLGTLTACFFATVALGSVPSGRLVDRTNPLTAMRISMVLSAAGLIGMGLLATSTPQLLGFLLISGLGCSIAMPAGSAALAGLAARSRGALFGMQQAAAPAASLVAGLTLPLVAVRFGWRMPFVLAGIVAAVLVLVPPATATWRAGAKGATGALDGPQERGPLLLVAVAIGMGAAAGVSAGAFLVDAVVSDGAAPGPAGLLLAGVSVIGVLARAGLPALADRAARRLLPGVAAMFALAAVGYSTLSVGGGWPSWLVGGAIAYGFGYGWGGLAFYAVVRLRPLEPARAVGFVNAGSAGGAALGPLLFGLTASRFSYSGAWAGAAAVSLLAATMLAWATRQPHGRSSQ